MRQTSGYFVDSAHYLRTAKIASDICVENNVRRYPLNPMRLASHYSIKVLSYEQLIQFSGNSMEELMQISRDGFALYKDQTPMIAYNASVSVKGRRRWTLLHECSHILLGHVGVDQSRVDALPQIARRRLEADAEELAACLIAPLGVAHLCNVQSAREMQAVFGLSGESAGYFFEDLSCLRTSGRISDLLFSDSLALCLPFIADRITLQCRVKNGVISPCRCPDVAYEQGECVSP